MKLHTIVEYLTNGYDLGFVYLVSLVSIAFGVYIIVAKNPVISILFLIGLFVTVSVYLMFSGFYFIGLSYLLVYVGAISILFIFILMLINVRISELTSEEKNSILLATLVVVSFNLIVTPVLPYSVYVSDILTNYLIKTYNAFMNLFALFDVYKNIVTDTAANAYSARWDSSLIDNNHITSIGNIMYSNLFILLIITSLILLLAMVGTIVITVKKNPIQV